MAATEGFEHNIAQAGFLNKWMFEACFRSPVRVLWKNVMVENSEWGLLRNTLVTRLAEAL